MSLFTLNEEGFRDATLPIYEYSPLKNDLEEQRFLILHPCLGDKADPANHVKCEFDVRPLSSAEPYIAVKNARGYRKLQEPIELDGKLLLVSAALERFLRHYRRSDQSVRLWVRYICLDEEDEHERERFWNRPFMESMYGKASSVVDMKDFVAGPIEQGVIEKVIDARFFEWTKDWEGEQGRGNMQLPSVFPIKLGQRPLSEAPMDKYEHVALDRVADEIRILVLVPAEDPSAPLVMHMAHCPVHCEVDYHALSYTWGDPQPLSEVIVNGLRMKVRQNLEKALRALRLPTNASVWWIDFVCINQLDTVERNREISRMSEIYDSAAIVICYVGDPDGDSHLALDLVKDLQEPMMRLDKDGNWQVGKEERVTLERLPRLCAALYRFLLRPYFRRVWVLQEVATSSLPTIACGHRFDISFEMLDSAAYNLQNMMGRDPGLVRKMKEVMPELNHVSVDELAFVRKLLYFRHLHMKGSRKTMLQVKIKDNAPGYLETAILARDFHASVPHDKIFALWNLARDKDGLEYRMDYNDSAEKTFTDFTVAWAKQKGSLDIIGAAESTTLAGSNSFYAKAPSWCADWSTPSEVSSLVRRETLRKTMMSSFNDMDGALYAADGGMQQKSGDASFFHFDDGTLRCTGIILDSITAVGKSDDESMLSNLGSLISATKTYFEEAQLTTYDDVEQAILAMLHGDCVSAWPRSGDCPENISTGFSDELFVCRPYQMSRPRLHNESRHVPCYGVNYSHKEAFDAVSMIMRGRVPFVSENGYMGLAPYYVKKPGASGPYLLAILATCSVPVLLQELPKRPGTFKLCGTCFVQGWMDGEMVTSYMGAETPQEFWAAVEGSEKLRIV